MLHRCQKLQILQKLQKAKEPRVAKVTKTWKCETQRKTLRTWRPQHNIFMTLNKNAKFVTNYKYCKKCKRQNCQDLQKLKNHENLKSMQNTTHMTPPSQHFSKFEKKMQECNYDCASFLMGWCPKRKVINKTTRTQQRLEVARPPATNDELGLDVKLVICTLHLCFDFS